MQGTFRLGRIAGIDVSAHWSWFLVFFLLSWSLATTLFEDEFPGWSGAQHWVAGVITTSFFFTSVLLHELSHSLVARRLGLPVSSITLFIFGGVSNLTREPDRPRDEFLIAIVGPGTSFVLAAICAVIWVATIDLNEPVSLVSGYLSFINAILGAFNMVPGFPLDGGRVFRSIVWARQRNLLRATRIASTTGVIVAYGLIAVGVIMTLTVALVSGIWFIFIGWFLKNASESNYQQMLLKDTLQGMLIANLINTSYTPVLPEITLRQLADQYILTQGHRYFPVLTGGGALLGLITLSDLRKVEQEKWEETTVYRAMTPAQKMLVLSPKDDAQQAFKLMTEHDVHQLPVVEDGLLMGFVTRADVLRLIQTRSELIQR